MIKAFLKGMTEGAALTGFILGFVLYVIMGVSIIVGAYHTYGTIVGSLAVFAIPMVTFGIANVLDTVRRKNEH